MKTSKIFLALLTFGLVAIFSSNVAAFNTVAVDSRVTVATNGVGDALMGGLYNTLNGQNTVIKIVNSSQTRAVVAKMIFRSPLLSREALDLMLFLTPGDVWEGTVTLSSTVFPPVTDPNTGELIQGEQQCAKLISYDDSCLNLMGEFASEGAPLEVDFFRDKLSYQDKNGEWVFDLNVFGHIEVIAATSFSASPQLAKSILKTGYSVAMDPRKSMDDNDAKKLGAVPSLSGGLTLSPGNGARVAAALLDAPNSLAGSIALVTGDNRGEIDFVALENLMPPTLYDNAGNFLANNVAFPQSLAFDSGFGNTANTVAEVEAAIAKTSWFYMYDLERDITNTMVLTCPTKYSPGYPVSLNYNANQTAFSGFQSSVLWQRIVDLVQPAVFNMQELSLGSAVSGLVSHYTLASEVTLLDINTIKGFDRFLLLGFNQGWVNLDFTRSGNSVWNAYAAGPSLIDHNLNTLADDNIRVGYTGAPILGSVISFTKGGDIVWKDGYSPRNDPNYDFLPVRQ